MIQSSHDEDMDQDSLFGSPPPSPARGRSPSQETLVAGGETGPIGAVGRKNVGTIALPGSHMSCAELPADLPASSSSPSGPTSRHHSSTPAVTSLSSARSVASRASSAASTVPSASASTRKRRTPKSKSSTPIPPPINLPGPNEPMPPNFLRSQSSLLGLAGLVGCVKPAQLFAHDRQHTPIQQPLSLRGSTPTHPIVIDDDLETPHTGRHSIGQIQIPQRLDQLDPESFRSNVTNSLTKEKNIFPVLESLIKLLGGEPHFPPANPSPQSFTRPYGHGIFHEQSSSPVPYPSAPGGWTTSTMPLSKRRKLKHVPAGAADWDVPFPFAAGEGPEEYRDTWARDRAKQLVTQLLQLVQNAAKRAAIKTVKSGGKVSKGRGSTRSRQSSRSTSVETQNEQNSPTQANVCESLPCTSSIAESAVSGTPIDSLDHYLGLLGTPNTIGLPASGSKDRMSVDSEGAVLVEGSAAVSLDSSAFEEWLSQLQQFFPTETITAIPELDWGTRPSLPLDSSASSPTPDILLPTQHVTRDEAIDPALLAISQQSGSTPSPTSTLTPGDAQQILDIPISPPPPSLAHSPRTSLSSLTEPLTPLSEAFVDPPTSTTAYQETVREPPTQTVEKNHSSRLANPIQPMGLWSSSAELSQLPHITAAQKGKARANSNAAPAAPSTPSRSTPSWTPTSKGTLDKQAILERAREHRMQLVAEIERAKIEIWETSIENAVLVHYTRGVGGAL